MLIISLGATIQPSLQPVIEKYFEKELGEIDIKNLNEDENRTLLAAIRAYRNNTYYAKPTEEKIEDAYEELGLHSIK